MPIIKVKSIAQFVIFLENEMFYICLNDLFAYSGLTLARKILTNFSKNSFHLLPEPHKLGDFLTNYCTFALYFS